MHIDTDTDSHTCSLDNQDFCQIDKEDTTTETSDSDITDSTLNNHSFSNQNGSVVYAICDVDNDIRRAVNESYPLNRRVVLSILRDHSPNREGIERYSQIGDESSFHITRLTPRHISVFPNRNRWWQRGQVRYGFKINNMTEEVVSRTFTPVFEPLEDKACPICLDDLTSDLVSLNGCLHVYHKDCFIEYAIKVKKSKIVCPLCNCISLTGRGPSPPGKMFWNVKKDMTLLSNGTFITTIEINYKIKSGTQLKWHPNPGKPYKGVSKKAFLPITTDYLIILKMLILAFLDGQTFRVEDSVHEDFGSTVWNGIEHKTNIDGGVEGGGFPDNNYKSRVMENILSKGIKL